MASFDGSKDDVLNNNYLGAIVLQLNGLTSAEIIARSVNDPDGTMYHNSDTNKLQVLLNDALETITSS